MTGRDLEGQTVLVTGAAQGIGAAIARRVAQAGAAVAVLDLDLARLVPVVDDLRTSGAPVLPLSADVADDEQTALALETLRDSDLGEADVLVNNAGIQLVAPALMTDRAAWDRTLDVNLRAPFVLSQRFARRWVEAGRRGTIVNIASIAGMVQFDLHTAYSVSKAGVRALTGALAYEWARHGIRVNAIAPGHIDTALSLVRKDPVLLAQRLATIPLARMGEPDDIARVAVFLASERSSYITGQTVVVDGGYTLQ